MEKLTRSQVKYRVRVRLFELTHGLPSGSAHIMGDCIISPGIKESYDGMHVEITDPDVKGEK